MDKQPVDLNGSHILITGAAGFIGYFLTRRLITEYPDAFIVGIDNMNDYYDPALKEWRLDDLMQTAGKSTATQAAGGALTSVEAQSAGNFSFIRGSIADKKTVEDIFTELKPQVVVNLAAQAGVRYSIENPDAYIESNIIGFYNILEACRHDEALEHLVYASSSSVYGGSTKVPFSTDDNVDHPVSLYAATKKSNELLAHSYSKLYNIPSTGLRFFTVYGPAGRPDMAYFSFTQKLTAGQNINIFNFGNCRRDFTYVDDIVEGVIRVMRKAPARADGDDGLPIPPYALYNIGGGQPENLMDFVRILGEELVSADILPRNFDIEKHMNLVPMRPGDVPVTYADSSGLERDYGFTPGIDLRTGLGHFAKWYKEYYR